MVHLFGSCAAPSSPQPAVPMPAQQGQPCAAAARAAADASVLANGTCADVQWEVLRIVAAGQRRPVDEIADGPDGESGDVELDSMTAVFAFSVIADILGPERMAALRGNCEPNDLTSTRSVAQLVCRLRRVVVTS